MTEMKWTEDQRRLQDVLDGVTKEGGVGAAWPVVADWMSRWAEPLTGLISRDRREARRVKGLRLAPRYLAALRDPGRRAS